jgi:hypothetical protein
MVNIENGTIYPLLHKMIVLPRQARDKHRESTQKEHAVFLQVNIMWTSNNLECCPDEPRSDLFFQRRLYLGVYPMAPLPAADHCIGYNSTIVPWYVNYGPLFAVSGRRFFLLAFLLTFECLSRACLGK